MILINEFSKSLRTREFIARIVCSFISLMSHLQLQTSDFKYGRNGKILAVLMDVRGRMKFSCNLTKRDNYQCNVLEASQKKHKNHEHIW